MTVPPAVDEIEITVFGPGYGESIVVHVGSGRWLVVDSCKQISTNRTVALHYFDRIGVDPSEQVDLVLISHWHDDHIRGASEIVMKCEKAEICVSGALTEKEFLRYLSVYCTNRMSPFGTGVDEFNSILSEIRHKKRKAHQGGEDKRIMHYRGSEFPHGARCEVWTLSPSDFQVSQSQVRFMNLIPEMGKTSRMAIPGGENNHSVAVWICIGDMNIILGADLEVTADERAGWHAVVESKNRPDGEVGFFKVPHHGSKNGHHEKLWTEILEKDVNAVVTPWNKGSGLPTDTDLNRLRKNTPNLHVTSTPLFLIDSRHGQTTDSMLQNLAIRPKQHPNDVGAVTARAKVGGGGRWKVENWMLD